MKFVLVACVTLTLAACGVDGEPTYPTTSNVIAVSNTGVSASTNVSVSQGPLTIGVGVGL